MKVLLAGNPNVGKSTLFNALTGLHQHTGNWPGKTVGLAKGTFRYRDRIIEVTDLPGTYSLEGSSQEEQIAAAAIRKGDTDWVLVVCDGCAMERSLILALQIMQRWERVILCINLMDEAETRGIRIQGSKLEKLLGIPVVLTEAGDKEGRRRLLEYMTRPHRTTEPTYFYEDPVAAAEDLVAQCVEQTEDPTAGWRHLLDRVLLSRRYGIPILLTLLFFMVWLTIFGANYPAAWLERLLDMVHGLLMQGTVHWHPWLRGILLEGMYATSARVLAVMLPPVAIFFTLFSFLEDVGYLPRMALLLDRPMCRCGGCGKQALTLCMGLGCNAVGVTGCRIIDSPKRRLAAILTNSMVPCNGRFPTLIVLAGLFFGDGWSALCVAGCLMLGILVAMVMAGLLGRSNHCPGGFIMEMPPIRRPRLWKILGSALMDRSLKIAGRALMVAAPAGAVMWILGNASCLGNLAELLDPLGCAMGMGGAILLGFLLALPANELLVPAILMVLTGGGSLAGIGDQSRLLLDALNWQNGVCMMVFTVFHWPCATTLMTIYRETGSKIKTAAAVLLPTAVGMMLCLLLGGIFCYFSG